MVYYAIAVGREVGVFTQPWSMVCKHVSGFSGAVYKKFSTRSEAEAFVREHSSTAHTESHVGSSPDVVSESRTESRGRISEASESEKGLHIYTDGGFRSGVTSAAIIVVLDGEEVFRKGKLVENGTNNRGELVAVRMAFQYLSKLSEEQFSEGAIIHPDSEYSIGVVSGTKEAKKNLDLVVPLKEWFRDAQPYVRFEHVEAHSGHRWNEEVDAICTQLIMEALSDQL